MKTFITSLIFIILGFSSTLFAGDGYKITLKVIDSYTHKPISNYEVQLKNETNELIFFKEIKNDTAYTIENIKSKILNIKIIPKNKKYREEITFNYIQNKKKTDINHSVYLYPNEQYEKEILHLEDSIYGPEIIREGPETNEEDTTKIEAKAHYNLTDYIAENFNAPDEYKSFSDKIIVKFYIEPNGKVSHCTIIKGRNDILKAEAIRVIRSSTWTPCHDRNGNNFRQQYSVPILIESK